MKITCIAALLFVIVSFSVAQNAVTGTGFSTGWNSTCNSNTGFTYMSASLGGSYIATLNPTGTGNRYFRMGVDWSGTVKQNTTTPGADNLLTPAVAYTLNSSCTVNGSMYFNVQDTADNYVFKTQNAGVNPSGKLIVFRVQGMPASFTSHSIPGAAEAQPGQQVRLYVDMNRVCPEGQWPYLRYHTGISFSAGGKVLPMQYSGTGTSYYVDIPAADVVAGRSFFYYFFTSGQDLNIANTDADFYTITYHNNNGSNFYFAVANQPGQDTFIRYGRNTTSAPQWKYRGGGTNLDGTNWKELEYAETGWLPRLAAFGFGSSIPVANTYIPEDNSAGGGGATGARYPTLYFRKIVNITNPAQYDNFKISTRFDDAVVIWVNGQEAYRNNIAANPSYSTLANTAIENNGADMYAAVISKSLFVPGYNTIAVEVHQAAPTSSDFYFDMELTGVYGAGAAITRNPYIMAGSTSALTFRWRTDIACNSSVRIIPAEGQIQTVHTLDTSTTHHEIRVQGLQPGTKYYYEAGTLYNGNFIQLQGGADNYFTTPPADTPGTKVSIVAFGDCGRNDFSYQANTLQAYRNYIGAPGNAATAWILLGDNAYMNGTESEYEYNFFNIYGNNILKNHILYPAPGNHDYADREAYKVRRDIPYYTNFSFPTKGECGGVPSGTPSYYSFDIGNVHFLSLDSYGKEGPNSFYDTLGAQATWVKADLEANTKPWVIAYWHHAPYTFGSHNSDTEWDLQAIRDNFIRILERYGVDMVLCGHSHAYERSYVLKDFFANSTAFVKQVHAVQASSGKYDGSANSCPYIFPPGKVNHGTVYVVSGSAGAGVSNTTALFNNPAGSHPFSLNTGGCFLIDVEDNRLDAKFLRSNGTIGDRFTIMKNVNRHNTIYAEGSQPLTLTASWPGQYYWQNPAGISTATALIAVPAVTTLYKVADNAGPNPCLQDSFLVKVSNVVINDSVCAGGNTVSFAPALHAAGNSYQWQLNTGDGFTNIAASQVFTGVQSDTLRLVQPPTNFAAYRFRCIITKQGVTDTTAAFQLHFKNSWQGVADNKWDNAANWNCGVLPDEYTDVTIESSSIQQPVVDTQAACRSLQVQKGAAIIVSNGATLHIANSSP
ncbi:MAG TPA: metallophosphoesterase family protein [Ferruginibacter sp.]|nr:metallophosphoesterase family protein [Ferruginibacter sp.]HMP20545.1 metallophosphoesterase family protein [Ferruginibacter sp.]